MQFRDCDDVQARAIVGIVHCSLFPVLAHARKILFGTLQRGGRPVFRGLRTGRFDRSTQEHRARTRGGRVFGNGYACVDALGHAPGRPRECQGAAGDGNDRECPVRDFVPEIGVSGCEAVSRASRWLV